MRQYLVLFVISILLLLFCGTSILAVPQQELEGAVAKSSESELRRRAMFGAQLAPVNDEVRERQKLDGNSGVVIEKIFPGTSAAASDFQEGDVILTVGGARVTGIPMFIESVAKARAGDVLMLELVRGGTKRETRVTLKEKPREKSEDYLTVYSWVTSHGAKLRTIITRPKAEGVILQYLFCKAAIPVSRLIRPLAN
jgi:PDZ domain-containing secreted protein